MAFVAGEPSGKCLVALYSVSEGAAYSASSVYQDTSTTYNGMYTLRVDTPLPQQTKDLISGQLTWPHAILS